MSRLVMPRSTTEPRAATPQTTPDTYKERIVKYIPAEAVAFYAFADKLIASKYGIVVDPAAGSAAAATTLADPVAQKVTWAIFLLGLIGTPIYLWKARTEGKPWVLHACISTIAFGLWAYTLGGSLFVLNGWYDVFWAGLAAPVFTFVAGMVEPEPETQSHAGLNE